MKNTMPRPQCCKIIYGPYRSRWQCTKPPVVARGGKHYCAIHDPIKVAELQKARNEKWESGYKKQREQMQKQQLAVNLFALHEAVAKAAEEYRHSRHDMKNLASSAHKLDAALSALAAAKEGSK